MRRLLAIAVVGAALLPSEAHACAVCFSGEDANRLAFVWATVFMTFTPLIVFGGAVMWYRKRIAAVEAGLVERD